MAEHRARHGGTGSVRASDLIARFDAAAGDSTAGRRRASRQDTADATPPRQLLAVLSVGAVGMSAAVSAVYGATPGMPGPDAPQSVDLQLAASPAAAAFTLSGPVGAASAPAPAVTGAALADAALPAAPTAEPAAPVQSGSDAPAFSDSITDRTAPRPVPVLVGPDVAAGPTGDAASGPADAALGSATKAARKADEAKHTTDAARQRAHRAEAALAVEEAEIPEAAADDVEPELGGSSIGLRAVAFAKANIGKPYRYGAAGPGAFDCSGLVMSAFRKAGVDLPRTSAAQSRVGTPVSRDQLKPGDLLFFYSPVSHVGIYIGGGMMVHASTSGEPVKISKLGNRPFHNARRL
jgi:cell wall-associated NlpC family hydrolase